MRKTAAVFSLLAGYYVITYSFYIFTFQSFIKDVFIAPLFFLVPTGFGLLLFSIYGTHRKLLKSITGLQLILSSAFLGFLTISLIYTELNNHNLLPAVFFITYPVLNFLSLTGFYRVRELLKINDTFNSIKNTLLISFPLLLIVYYYLFIHFSPFPLRDIFMEVHFMKGALEFSKYNIINIFTGDSYFALLQVHSGLLHHFFSYNLINSQWILPAYMFLLYFLCFYCFYSSFIKDRIILVGTLCFNTIFTSLMFSNSNNSYLIMLTMVFFSVLVSVNRERSRALPVFLELLVLCGLSVVFYFLREVPSYANTMLPYLTVNLIILFALSALNLNRFLPPAFTMLLLLIAPPYHRAASLYIPLMVLLYALFFMCFQWRSEKIYSDGKDIFKKAIIYCIICTPVIIAMEVLITIGWPSTLTSYIRDILNPIFVLMVGQTISENQGIIGTTSEFLRNVTPLVYFVFALLALEIIRKKGSDSTRHFIEVNLNHITFCTVSTLLFLIVLYSPLPNIHRVLVFPVLMIFALTSVLFRYFYETCLMTAKGPRAPLLLAGTIALYTFFAGVIYNLPWEYPYVANAYLAELSPVTHTGWAVITISLVTLLFVRKAALISFLTISILICGLFLDKVNMVTKLYGNSYGYDFPEPKVISHYTMREINTAERLGELIDSPLNLMFSDPSTLGIFESQTGINGFYTFSNLGVMNAIYKDALKEIIRNSFPDVQEYGGILNDKNSTVQNLNIPDHPKRNMDIMLMLAEFCDKHKGAVPEARYTIQTKFGNPFELGVFENDYTKWANEYKDRIYWIVNEKTIRWAYGDVGYYPMNTPFSQSYIKENMLPYFDIILNSENSVLVLRLK